MDSIFKYGIDIILSIQVAFKDYEQPLILLSKLGDPSAAFFIYFPLMFAFNPLVGVKIVWTGALSELANCVFKWLLYGPRPYWWVHTSGIYGENIPILDQYHITCETGPGSPSGHCMVTGAVLYVLCNNLLKSSPDSSRNISKFIIWPSYVAFMLGVCISRCFIATHFPHQVLAGVISGLAIGVYMDKVLTDIPSVKSHLLTSISIISIGFGLYGILETLNFDTFWSVKLAETWCQNPAWVTLDTTIFYSIVKDSAAITGMALSIYFYPIQRLRKNKTGLFIKIILAFNVLYISHICRYIKPSSADSIQFYLFSYIQMSAINFIVIFIHKIYFRMFSSE